MTRGWGGYQDIFKFYTQGLRHLADAYFLLKVVVGNEKRGWGGGVVGKEANVRQSMFIYILNMQILCKNLIPITAYNSKIIWRVWIEMGSKKNPWIQNCFLIHSQNSVRIAINAGLGCIVTSIYWHIDLSSRSSFSCGYPVIQSFQPFHMSYRSKCPFVPYVLSFHMSGRSICPVVPYVRSFHMSGRSGFPPVLMVTAKKQKKFKKEKRAE